jgi:hypothetical protein
MKQIKEVSLTNLLKKKKNWLKEREECAERREINCGVNKISL